MRKLFILILLLTGYQLLWSQTGDVEIKPKADGKIITNADDSAALKHSPKVAALLSLVPGGGQVYNKKYWKVPLIYAVGGALVYFADQNYKSYQLFRETYISRVDTTSDAIDHFATISTSGVSAEMERTQKNFELLVIGVGLIYVAQIVDAAVDAHLRYFDVSDNLSMQIKPKVSHYNTLLTSQNRRFTPTVGLSIKLRLK